MTVPEVLLTGAAGRIGTMLLDRLGPDDVAWRCVDVDTRAATHDVPWWSGSIGDRALLYKAVAPRVDAIVHLAAISGENTWDAVLEHNIEGTKALLDVAVKAGVGKVVLASSNHAAGFHERPVGQLLPADAAPRPDTFYGWTKAANESLARLYHDRFGLDVVAVRIGSCFPEPRSHRELATWLSPDDAARLVHAAVQPSVHGFHLIWGVSANTRAWWTLDEGARIGYLPRDDAEAFASRFPEEGKNQEGVADPVRVGGSFCEMPLGEPMR